MEENNKNTEEINNKSAEEVNNSTVGEVVDDSTEKKDSGGMEEMDNMDTEDVETEKEVSLGGNVGIVKKIFIFLLVFIVFVLIFLFSLQRIIKLKKVRDNNNTEISQIIIEEFSENLPKDKKDDKISTSLVIKGSMSFKSFPTPHILIENVEGKDLIDDKYLANFNIEKIKLILSLKSLLEKKFVVKEIEVINGNFNVKELYEKSGIKVFSRIFDKYFTALAEKNPNVKISLKDTDIILNGIKYQRELTNIDVSIDYNKKKLSLLGKLSSSKQPLNIDIHFSRNNNDNFDGKINLNSQAFTFNTTIKGNFKNLKFSGNSNLNLINPEIFSRTIFNPTDFLYKRIIDNTNLKINYEFNFENDMLNIKNITFNGANLKGSGNAQFNFIAEQKNTVDFNIDTINLDALVIKNLINQNKNNVKEEDAIIFSKVQPEEITNNYKGFIESKLKINPTIFNIKLKEILFNQKKISNVELDFSYIDDYKYKFNKVIAKFPYETDLTIENKDDNQVLNIKGADLYRFWNFLKNTNVALSKNLEDKKTKFEFNGIISVDKGRLFVNEGNFSTDDLKSKNTIEVKFDSGISFIAIDTKIDNLVLDKFISKEEDKLYMPMNTLKNKILFLNKFALNTFLKFEIGNIQYKDFKDANYNFIVRTSQGILEVYNMDINDKIKGKILFNIIKSKPTLDIKLEVKDINIKNNIDLNKLLFDSPTLEDFYGNINIAGNNISFKNSPINTFETVANLKNGTINFTKFEINGFGGKCNINGFLDMQYSKKLNLTFGGCTANLKYLLPLFGGMDNISGTAGFSSVLYAEGQNKENFIQSYVMKTQMVASGITIKKFGLGNLSSDLFSINKDEELLNSLNPEKVLYNENNETVFEKMPKGLIQYSKKNGGQFDFDLNKLMINGKVSGSFKIFPEYLKVELNSNFVLLSGTIENTIPLNLAIALNGNTNEKLGISTNFQNIDSYISYVKVQFEEFKKQQEEKRIKKEQEKLKKEKLRKEEEKSKGEEK